MPSEPWLAIEEVGLAGGTLPFGRFETLSV